MFVFCICSSNSSFTRICFCIAFILLLSKDFVLLMNLFSKLTLSCITVFVQHLLFAVTVVMIVVQYVHF